MNRNGFSIVEFLISVVAIFSGVYFIFWFSYLATNYTLAKYYLDDFSFCELKSNPKNCLTLLKRRVDSLKFVEIQKLETETIGSQKKATLVFNFDLPILGFDKGIKNIRLSSTSHLERSL